VYTYFISGMYQIACPHKSKTTELEKIKGILFIYIYSCTVIVWCGHLFPMLHSGMTFSAYYEILPCTEVIFLYLVVFYLCLEVIVSVGRAWMFCILATPLWEVHIACVSLQQYLLHIFCIR